MGGHQRLKVLIAQGLQEVDVSVVDLDIQQEKALQWNGVFFRIQGRLALGLFWGCMELGLFV